MSATSAARRSCCSPVSDGSAFSRQTFVLLFNVLNVPSKKIASLFMPNHLKVLMFRFGGRTADKMGQILHVVASEKRNMCWTLLWLAPHVGDVLNFRHLEPKIYNLSGVRETSSCGPITRPNATS